jgi:glycosyltransferase involved in cell wall biosynthesis
MRVIQIIDSLNTGGAERVAVNLANQLVGKIGTSFLCATRKEGLLKEELNDNVEFFFLNRTKTLDIKAIWRLKSYIKANKIDIIHAHASSYFISTIVKLLLPKVRLIWHDHLGNRAQKKSKASFVLKICSFYFNAVITVNKDLANWATKNLKTKEVTYIPNFTVRSRVSKYTVLEGVENKRILYLANLRDPKNHLFLLTVFTKLIKIFPDWTLHLVGKDYHNDYSEKVKNYIKSNNLTSHVFLLGQRKDVAHIINQCNIGVITSTYEGLPLALLEYGLGGLAVISTDVGQCKDVIAGHGIVVKSQSKSELTEALKIFMSNEKLRINKSTSYNLHINQNYKTEHVINSILTIYAKS